LLPLGVCRRLCRFSLGEPYARPGEKSPPSSGTAARAREGITLRCASLNFRLRSAAEPLSHRRYAGSREVEVLLVNVFGDVHTVEHRAFKLLNIRVLRAHRVDQIVRSWKIRPSAPMIWRISSTSRP
jgi:hypothetical protein